MSLSYCYDINSNGLEYMSRSVCQESHSPNIFKADTLSLLHKELHPQQINLFGERIIWEITGPRSKYSISYFHICYESIDFNYSTIKE